MVAQERTEAAEQCLVGIADLVVRPAGSVLLHTHPLGSGMGVAIYDPVTKVGGLWHAMLPDSSIDARRAQAHPAMFLNTGLAELLKRADDLDVKKENLLVYAAGGGRIMDATGYFNIGAHNHEVLVELLAREGLKVCAADVGGLANRTMQLYLATGEVRLKISGQPKTRILCKP